MLFWFAATAIWSVWFVFRDPKFDYRILAISALLPVRSVVTCIAVLALIMIATAGRKPIRQRLLAIPIGAFMHLIFDGAFANSKTFWWPITGISLDGAMPSTFERGLLNLPLEIAGAVGCLVAWRYFALNETSRRRKFLKTGSLSRSS